jgi:hypothetical protein
MVKLTHHQMNARQARGIIDALIPHQLPKRPELYISIPFTKGWTARSRPREDVSVREAAHLQSSAG